MESTNPSGVGLVATRCVDTQRQSSIFTNLSNDSGLIITFSKGISQSIGRSGHVTNIDTFVILYRSITVQVGTLAVAGNDALAQSGKVYLIIISIEERSLVQVVVVTSSTISCIHFHLIETWHQALQCTRQIDLTARLAHILNTCTTHICYRHRTSLKGPSFCTIREVCIAQQIGDISTFFITTLDSCIKQSLNKCCLFCNRIIIELTVSDDVFV